MGFRSPNAWTIFLFKSQHDIVHAAYAEVRSNAVVGLTNWRVSRGGTVGANTLASSSSATSTLALKYGEEHIRDAGGVLQGHA